MPVSVLLVPFHVGEFVKGFLTPAGAMVLEPPLPSGSRQERMIVLFRELANRVAADQNAFVFSGDCMAPLGILAGLQRRGISPFIVWLDAHGDFNTWETTPSGYIGGMPLAMLTGCGEQTILQALELQTVEADRVVLADARDVDPEEGIALAGSGIRVADVDEIVGLVPSDLPIFVHLDVDVVTPAEMPALRFPAKGGPSRTQVETALRSLAGTGRVVGACIACTWDPSKPGADEAATATARLAGCLSGA